MTGSREEECYLFLGASEEDEAFLFLGFSEEEDAFLFLGGSDEDDAFRFRGASEEEESFLILAFSALFLLSLEDDECFLFLGSSEEDESFLFLGASEEDESFLLTLDSDLFLCPLDDSLSDYNFLGYCKLSFFFPLDEELLEEEDELLSCFCFFIFFSLTLLIKLMSYSCSPFCSEFLLSSLELELLLSTFRSVDLFQSPSCTAFPRPPSRLVFSNPPASKLYFGANSGYLI